MDKQLLTNYLKFNRIGSILFTIHNQKSPNFKFNSPLFIYDNFWAIILLNSMLIVYLGVLY